MDQSETQIEGALKWIAHRDRRPHFEDPRLDPQLNKYVIETFPESNEQEGPDSEVLILFLEPIVSKLPKKKTLIFRRFDQLRRLIKLIARIYRQQRIHCLVDGKQCILAHPIDFQYATDILGPGAMAGIRDARIDMIYDKMQPDTIYDTKEIADLMDRTPGWAYPRLTALEQEGRIERLEQISRSFRFRRIENVPTEDPLQAKYLEGYEYHGPLFNQWLEEVQATIVYEPKRPVYYNPLSFSDASGPQTALNNAKSEQLTRTLPYSAIVESRLTISNTVGFEDKSFSDYKPGVYQVANSDPTRPTEKPVCQQCYVQKRYGSLTGVTKGPQMNVTCEDCGKWGYGYVVKIPS